MSRSRIRTGILSAALVALLGVTASSAAQQPQEDGVLIFAVVTSISKDRQQVMAQVSEGGQVVEATLIPSETIHGSSIWRTLEICHSLRAYAAKADDGYHLLKVRAIEAGMLPMAMQGLAGDCLLKKALDFAPLVD